MSPAVWFIPSRETEPGASERLALRASAIGLELRLAAPWSPQDAPKPLHAVRRRARRLAAVLMPLGLLTAVPNAFAQLEEVRAKSAGLALLVYSRGGEAEPKWLGRALDAGLLTRLVVGGAVLRRGRWRIVVPAGISPELACLALVAMPRHAPAPHVWGTRPDCFVLAKRLKSLLSALGWSAMKRARLPQQARAFALANAPVAPERGEWLPATGQDAELCDLVVLLLGLMRTEPTPEQLAALAQVMAAQRALVGRPVAPQEALRLAPGLQVRLTGQAADGKLLWVVEGSEERRDYGRADT